MTTTIESVVSRVAAESKQLKVAAAGVGGTAFAGAGTLLVHGVVSHNHTDVIEGGVGVVVAGSGWILAHVTALRTAVSHAQAWVAKEDPQLAGLAGDAANAANSALNQISSVASRVTSLEQQPGTTVSATASDPNFAAAVKAVLKEI